MPNTLVITDEQIELKNPVIEIDGKFYYKYLILNDQGEFEERLAPL